MGRINFLISISRPEFYERRLPLITRATLEFQPGEIATPATFLTPPSHEGILSLDETEKQAISTALRTTSGNIKKTASALGISRTTLYNKLRKYDLSEKGEPQ